MAYFYARPTGVIVKVKLMCVVGQNVQPTNLALQGRSLSVSYGVP